MGSLICPLNNDSYVKVSRHDSFDLWSCFTNIMQHLGQLFICMKQNYKFVDKAVLQSVMLGFSQSPCL